MSHKDRKSVAHSLMHYWIARDFSPFMVWIHGTKYQSVKGTRQRQEAKFSPAEGDPWGTAEGKPTPEIEGLSLG